MSWQHPRLPGSGTLLPLPDDGVAVSNHPPGWLGTRWQALVDEAGREAKDRIRRGRNYARRGRLRLLEVSPGCASADVVCEDSFRPTLHVRPFSKAEWQEIVAELTVDLNLIASLLEGELPRDFVQRLEARGIGLLPTFEELSFDCSCGDYVMPCDHVATVFHVLTDALDGDPFLLLTLRGRDREHLLSTLRSDWGDDAPLVIDMSSEEESPPEGDWFTSPAEIPDFACAWDEAAAPGAGLRSLGPPPGEADLLSTLMPLYEAGHERVRQTLEALVGREVRRRPAAAWSAPTVVSVEVGSDEDVPDAAEVAAAVARAEEAGEELPTTVDADVPPVARQTPPPPDPEPVRAPLPQDQPSRDLEERLIQLLADGQGHLSGALASALGVSVSQVRAELVDLLELGLVYREQDARGVRWFLG